MSGNFLTPCSGWAALAAHEPVSPLGLADSPFPPPQPLPYPTPVLSPPAAARLLAHLLVREPLLACPPCCLRGPPFPGYALLTLAANVPASASSEACPVDLLASAPLALARGPPRPRPWTPSPVVPHAVDLGHGRSPGCLRPAPIGPDRFGPDSPSNRRDLFSTRGSASVPVMLPGFWSFSVRPFQLILSFMPAEVP